MCSISRIGYEMYWITVHTFFPLYLLWRPYVQSISIQVGGAWIPEPILGRKPLKKALDKNWTLKARNKTLLTKYCNTRAYLLSQYEEAYPD